MGGQSYCPPMCNSVQSPHAPTVMVRTTQEAEMVWNPTQYEELAKSVTGYHIRDGLRNMMQKCCGSHLIGSEDEELESLVRGDIFAESPPLTPTNERAAHPETSAGPDDAPWLLRQCDV